MPELLHLTDVHKAVLDFEAETPTGVPAARNEVVRDRFGLGPAEYHAVLDYLIDQPVAAVHAPETVHRLRAERERRRATTSPWRDA